MTPSHVRSLSVLWSPNPKMPLRWNLPFLGIWVDVFIAPPLLQLLFCPPQLWTRIHWLSLFCVPCRLCLQLSKDAQWHVENIRDFYWDSYETPQHKTAIWRTLASFPVLPLFLSQVSPGPYVVDHCWLLLTGNLIFWWFLYPAHNAIIATSLYIVYYILRSHLVLIRPFIIQLFWYFSVAIHSVV